MKPHSILLVDDEEIIRLTLANDLKRMNLSVTLAASAEEAMKKLNQNKFDLVITDLIMKGKDGIEVIKDVRKLNPDTMVMVLTGYGSLDSAIAALQLGASDYLLKPCDRKEFAIRVNNCLEKYEMNQKIKLFENILPMCCVCNKIRDDQGKEPGEGHWLEIGQYLHRRSKVDVSHGFCPDCYERQNQLVDDFINERQKNSS